MRLSRMLRPVDVKPLDDSISLTRAVFWIVVWIGLIGAIILYFKYARLLTPLLG